MVIIGNAASNWNQLISANPPLSVTGFKFDWAAMTSQVMFLFPYIYLTQVTKDLQLNFQSTNQITGYLCIDFFTNCTGVAGQWSREE